MRTHTYWITYEEYLAYGVAPRKPRFNKVIFYRRAPRMGVDGGVPPYCNSTGGLRGIPPCRVHIKFID